MQNVNDFTVLDTKAKADELGYFTHGLYAYILDHRDLVPFSNYNITTKTTTTGRKFHLFSLPIPEKLQLFSNPNVTCLEHHLSIDEQFKSNQNVELYPSHYTAVYSNNMVLSVGFNLHGGISHPKVLQYKDHQDRNNGEIISLSKTQEIELKLQAEKAAMNILTSFIAHKAKQYLELYKKSHELFEQLHLALQNLSHSEEEIRAIFDDYQKTIKQLSRYKDKNIKDGRESHLLRLEEKIQLRFSIPTKHSLSLQETLQGLREKFEEELSEYQKGESKLSFVWRMESTIYEILSLEKELNDHRFHARYEALFEEKYPDSFFEYFKNHFRQGLKQGDIPTIKFLYKKIASFKDYMSMLDEIETQANDPIYTDKMITVLRFLNDECEIYRATFLIRRQSTFSFADKSAQVNSIYRLIANNNPKMLEVYLEHGFSPNFCYMPRLQHSSLDEKKLQHNYRPLTLLCLSEFNLDQQSQEQMIKLLIKHGASLSILVNAVNIAHQYRTTKANEKLITTYFDSFIPFNQSQTPISDKKLKDAHRAENAIALALTYNPALVNTLLHEAQSPADCFSLLELLSRLLLEQDTHKQFVGKPIIPPPNNDHFIVSGCCGSFVFCIAHSKALLQAILDKIIEILAAIPKEEQSQHIALTIKRTKMYPLVLFTLPEKHYANLNMSAPLFLHTQKHPTLVEVENSASEKVYFFHDSSRFALRNFNENDVIVLINSLNNKTLEAIKEKIKATSDYKSISFNPEEIKAIKRSLDNFKQYDVSAKLVTIVKVKGPFDNSFQVKGPSDNSFPGKSICNGKELNLFPKEVLLNGDAPSGRTLLNEIQKKATISPHERTLNLHHLAQLACILHTHPSFEDLLVLLSCQRNSPNGTSYALDFVEKLDKETQNNLKKSPLYILLEQKNRLSNTPQVLFPKLNDPTTLNPVNVTNSQKR